LTLRVHDAICGRGLLFRIAQDWIIRLDVLGEFLVGFGVVDAGREVRDILERLELFAARTERLALGRSTSSERRGKPGKHHGLALVVRQPMDLAVGSLKRELGRLISNLEYRFRGRWRPCRRCRLLVGHAQRDQSARHRPSGE
jgi:hypothetical protein